jgi:hypothetical protein
MTTIAELNSEHNITQRLMEVFQDLDKALPRDVDPHERLEACILLALQAFPDDFGSVSNATCSAFGKFIAMNTNSAGKELLTGHVQELMADSIAAGYETFPDTGHDPRH